MKVDFGHEFGLGGVGGTGDQLGGFIACGGIVTGELSLLVDIRGQYGFWGRLEYGLGVVLF
jgi:hypothetical protein